MLLIPLILPNEKRTILLGDPLPIQELFDDLEKNSTSCHEIGIVSITRGIGSARHIPAFLLIAADGSVFDLDVKDMPEASNSDIVFYRAVCSPEWGNEFANVHATR